ncbi:MAG: STAS domain-containing protein [Polyangiaceae bacterium]|nr:STAS domain-containing protein [Polyangiaceae bacterium]
MEDGGQAAEIERLRARVAALEEQLAERERSAAAARAEAAALRAMIEQLPIGLMAADSTGKVLVVNATALKIVGDGTVDQPLDDVVSKFGIFEPDKTTVINPENIPLARAMRGEVVRGAETFIRSQNFPDGAWLESYAAPFATADNEVTGGVIALIDCGQRKFLEEEATAQNAALTAAEAEKLEIITRLRTAVEQLSTPILELWEDVLALPVIGIVDSRRSAEMMERLLQEIVQKQSRFVIIDLTGVEVIDTSTADHFMKLVKAVGLIGARCVLTGIRPAVAQTLVDLDVSFGQLETLRNLRHGLRYCLRWLDNEGV